MRKLVLSILVVLLALPNLGCPGTIAFIVIMKKRASARRAAAATQAEKTPISEENRNQTAAVDESREKQAPEPVQKAPETAPEAPATRSDGDQEPWKPARTSVVRNAF